jgi:hypothetical protein
MYSSDDQKVTECFTVREEVLNVALAGLLKKRGLLSSASIRRSRVHTSIFATPQRHRIIPLLNHEAP